MPMLPLLQTTDLAEIERIIRGGPSSCVHPLTVRALYPGDWAAAWMEGKDGKIISRVVGCAYTKTYIGIYGYQSHPQWNKDHFLAALTKAGWKNSLEPCPKRKLRIVPTDWPQDSKPVANWEAFTVPEKHLHMGTRFDIASGTAYEKLVDAYVPIRDKKGFINGRWYTKHSSMHCVA